MRARIGLAVLPLVLLGVCLGAAARSRAEAQYQDRDSRGEPATSKDAPAPEDRIDINHASLKQLLKVPGMTPSWAGRIMRFRPYRTKAALLEQGVVNSQVYDRIKDYVIAHHNPQ